MVCALDPVDQRLLLAEEEVSATEPPAQKVVEPPALIDGAAGFALIVTVVAAEVAEQPEPLVTVTVYDPAELTVIDWFVEPFDQRLPEAEEEVKVTDPPAQKLVAPLAVMVGVTGFAFTVTVVEAEVAEHPFPSV